MLNGEDVRVSKGARPPSKPGGVTHSGRPRPRPRSTFLRPRTGSRPPLVHLPRSTHCRPPLPALALDLRLQSRDKGGRRGLPCLRPQSRELRPLPIRGLVRLPREHRSGTPSPPTPPGSTHKRQASRGRAPPPGHRSLLRYPSKRTGLGTWRPQDWTPRRF
ncbi:hypothetical protein NDU88_006143 [Pleurodeles waltl]|uniref:Uncharacterized protein n=1 Tax=Pleurodeles waltl TaxID=8319 RepID=A0AAV7MYC4_PLEWA|nr:hypothetical protein NDU88_006143 [Pleurodeles waltl]